MSCLLERRSFLVVPILLVAACAGWEPETEAERELRLSRERLQSTVGQGGLTGAAGGALLGALVGGAGGAFQGAEIGRLAGAAAGAYVRQLQAEYASQEAVMVQVAADLRATNAEMQRSIDAMRAVLAQTRAAGEEDVVRRNRNAATSIPKPKRPLPPPRRSSGSTSQRRRFCPTTARAWRRARWRPSCAGSAKDFRRCEASAKIWPADGWSRRRPYPTLRN